MKTQTYNGELNEGFSTALNIHSFKHEDENGNNNFIVYFVDSRFFTSVALQSYDTITLILNKFLSKSSFCIIVSFFLRLHF